MKLQQSILMSSLVALGATTFFVEPAKAEIITYGPFEGFKKTVKPPPKRRTLTLKAKAQGIIEDIPHDGDLPFNISSSQKFEINETVPVIASIYIQLESSMAVPFDGKIDSNDYTVVWGLDLDPVLPLALSPIVPPMSVTGFDPADPEIVPIGDTVFKGKSGTLYTAPIISVPLSGLSAVLPPLALPDIGYDLSAFTGDPDSIVYVSQVTVPASDFICVPEPSTILGLLTFGLLGSSAAYKRHLQKKSIKSEEGEITKV